MSKSFALMGTVVAVALAFVTSGMESPTQHRVRRGGRDLRRNPAFLVGTPSPGSVDGEDSMTAAHEPGDGAPGPQTEPEPTEPETPEVVFETREIDNEDLVLCMAENGRLPPVARIIDLEVLSEGEVFWYAPGGSKEQESDRMLGKRLAQRPGRHLAIVPHEWTNWLRFRELCEVARKNGFADRMWIGVATEKEPRKLTYLPFRLDRDESADLDDGSALFRIGIKEGDDEKGEYTVNDEPVESLGADLAIAWVEWKKAHPDEAKRVADPDGSPVVLEVHRYTPMKLVVPVIDRLRGIDIPAERLGEPPKRR